ncbi:MAG: acetate kinase, partial [Casimicrobiaceae bacterium]
GGLDALVFTGGIGERAAPVRAQVLAQAAWLGLALDESANGAHATRITAGTSRIPAYVIPTDEERMIALHTRALVGATGVA